MRGRKLNIGRRLPKSSEIHLQDRLIRRLEYPAGEKNEILNKKNEFNHPPIARITVERSKNCQNKN